MGGDSEKGSRGLTRASSPAADGRPSVAPRELPDDLRVPLHELQADAGYLVGRVAADSSTSEMVLQVFETKLSRVAEAAYRLNGSRNDLLEACRLALRLTVAPSSDTIEADIAQIRAALANAEV